MTVVIEGASSGIWNSPIIAGAFALAGVILGGFLSYIFAQKEAIKNKKRMYYGEFLSSFIKLTTMNNEESRIELINAYEIIKIWAPKDVLDAIANALKYITGESDKNEFDNEINARYYKIIEVMRKDLGVKTNFEINKSNVCMIK